MVGKEIIILIVLGSILICSLCGLCRAFFLDVLRRAFSVLLGDATGIR